MIGVTGTDGKTTTVHMIYEILKSAGKKVSLISSINAQVGNKSFDTGFHVTTPDPIALLRFLQKIVKEGTDYLVLEVTSHGLDQNRVFGIKFDVAVLTNITHEHLDYHKTFNNYLKAKVRLFKHVEYSILNVDDQSFGQIKKAASGKIISYSLYKNADFNLKNFPIKLGVAGEYNFYNALAAAAATSALGIDRTTVYKALSSFKGVLGRMENVDLGQEFKVIIDFAHTPNALSQALKTLNSKLKTQNSKLIAVFGTAGQRDRTKRPLMGQVAAQYADISVITAEDPRTERVEDICAQIAEGFKRKGKRKGKDFYFVYDRQKAIEFAVNLAEKGDIVATFGKSHEKSMCYGKKEYPWDEFAQVKKAIKRRLAHGQK